MALTYTQATGVAATVAIDTGTLKAMISIIDFPEFAQRVEALAAIVATALRGEDSSVANSTARQAYALAIAADRRKMAANAIGFIVADNSTNTSSTDQQIVDSWLAAVNLIAG